MQGSDVLLTIAELAVAFAGFSSIVVVFQHRDPAQWSPAISMRLRAMIEGSLGALYAALLPFALEGLGMQGVVLWRAASAGAFLALAIQGAVLFRRARALLPQGELKRGFTFGTAAVNLLVMALLLANSAGALGPPGYGPYVVAVIWGLVVASLVFLRLMLHPLDGNR